MRRRPNVMVCNDDGVHAPANEQSGKSQSITLGKPIVTRRLQNVHPEVICCIEVHGTPADAVMVGLYSDILSSKAARWDLVVSGINRGDNLGLHVIYSGTVGAAREAACKAMLSSSLSALCSCSCQRTCDADGVAMPVYCSLYHPSAITHLGVQDTAAIAFSLDAYKASTLHAFSQAAVHCAAFVKGTLMRWFDGMPRQLVGNIVNVNIPGPSCSNIKGFYLTTMGRSSMLCGFQRASGQLISEAVRDARVAVDDPDVTVLANTKTTFRGDMTVGSDCWAVRNGYISVTPLDLMQDFSLSADHLDRGRQFVSVVWDIMNDVAVHMALVADRSDTPKL